VRVKICGITRREDAELAVSLGANALGFVLWPGSPRQVNAAQVAALTRGLPPSVARVGVFVDAPPAEVRDVIEETGLDAIQLHGSETVNEYRFPGVSVIKSFDLAEEGDVARAMALPAHVTPLIDAHDRTRRGGTGQPSNWARAAEVARARSILLAGGLSAENVAEAIEQVGPWGIDVSSGVESAPGIKSPDRLRALFAAVGRP
jgi:phosphoribosylanthranilate isomerase